MSTTLRIAYACSRRVRLNQGVVLTVGAALLITGVASCQPTGRGDTHAKSPASRLPASASSAHTSLGSPSGKLLDPVSVRLARSALSGSNAIWTSVERAGGSHENGEVLNPGRYTLEVVCVGSGSVTVRVDAGSPAPSTVLPCAAASKRAELSVSLEESTLVTAVAAGKASNTGVLAWQLRR